MGLFSRTPKPVTCFLCSQAVEGSLQEHYKTHLIKVTDDNGFDAFTFVCPRCGPMDRAWGGGRPDPAGNGAAAVAGHLIQAHGIMP